MASDVPMIVVLALGAGALGGPDALRLLVAVAGRNSVVDIGICVFVLAVVTAQLFGAALLARFIRKAAPGAGRGAPAADPLAQATLLLSLAAASLVAACLAVVSAGPGSVHRLLVDFAAEYYPVAAAAAGAALPYAMPLLRTLREWRNARAAGPAGRAGATTTRRTARFTGVPLVAAAAAVCAVAITFAARGGLDALRLPSGFTDIPAAVAIPFAARGGLDAPRFPSGMTAAAAAVATVVGATLLRFSRRVRNAAAAGGGSATRAHATASRTCGASAT